MINHRLHYHTRNRDMFHGQRSHAIDDEIDGNEIRDIHTLNFPQPTSIGSRRSSTLSLTSELENLSTMSREFSAMVAAGTTLSDNNNNSNNQTNINNNNNNNDGGGGLNLARIGEEHDFEETNPLAIVPDNNPVPSPRRRGAPRGDYGATEEVSVHSVKKEEAESKIAAWQTAEVAKINNRFKREDVVINGWESEKIDKATSWLKNIERRLDERRARAVEKAQNRVAMARQRADEKRASAEAKRGKKIARILETANLMKIVGRAPAKCSFF